MAEILIHNFVTTKPDGSDPELVSANEWNDGHRFSQGINGQTLIADNTTLKGIRWADGRAGSSSTYQIQSTTPTPISDANPIPKTFNSNNVVQAIVQVFYITTVGAVNTFVELQRNSITIASTSFVSNGAYLTFSYIANVIPGSHTYTLKLTTTGNANILTAMFTVSIDSSGI